MVTLELTSTRREILVALLGGAMAGSCRRRTPELSWDGGFVEDYARVGHRLRDGPPLGPPTEETRARVLVLGAGIAGLTAGWTLRRAGQDDLRVLEIAEQPGGTSAFGRSEVSAYPWGAHYVPAPTADNPDLVALLREMGAVDPRGDGLEYAEQVLCASPKERVFHQGAWHAGLVPRLGQSAAEVEQWARFEAELARWIAFRDPDGRRAFTLPMAFGSDAPEVRALDEISFGRWLSQRGLTAPRLRWYANYACRDDFGTDLEQTSAFHGLHYFSARTPAPDEDSAEVLTWPEGNGRVASHLAAAVGAGRIETGQLVLQIRPDGSRVSVLTLDVARGVTRRYVADRVICALPSYLRSRLLPEAPAYAPAYAPWMVANLHLSDRPGSHGAETAWDNVIYDSASLGYVVATHQTDIGRGPTVWTWYRPFTGADPTADRKALASVAYREAADAIVHELDHVHFGLKPMLQRVDIRRWGHGMVRPEVGTAFSAARRAAAAPWRGVHFAHTDLSGVALIEEAVFHGVRAGREVLAALGGGA